MLVCEFGEDGCGSEAVEKLPGGYVCAEHRLPALRDLEKHAASSAVRREAAERLVALAKVPADPREAAWTADDKRRDGGVETTSDLLDRLAAYLDEAHAEEIEGDHAGDADHDGPAPEACSYCEAAATARERAAALRAVRS